MGEIGGNDYNHALTAGKSIDEVETYVPYVINTIVLAVNVRIYTIYTFEFSLFYFHNNLFKSG